MRSPLLILVALAALSVLAAVVGQALDFGGPAWLAALLVVGLLTSLVDRERFYGPRRQRRRSVSGVRPGPKL